MYLDDVIIFCSNKNYKMSFEVHVDASHAEVETVLYQTQAGQKRVMSYASRGLSTQKKHYSALKLKFLVLKRCITEKCHNYLKFMETHIRYIQTIIH